MSRRIRNKSHNTTDVYRQIMKNLNQNWMACALFSIIVILQMLVISDGGMTWLSGFTLLFSSLILIQSIRGTIRLSALKQGILKHPDSVTMAQVNEAPQIKILFWLP